MEKLLFIVLLTSLSLSIFAQEKTEKWNASGQFSLGQRLTVSSFFNNEFNQQPALGLGGQFRVRLSNRINTEWFADYLPSSTELIQRTDAHIGWSVLFYLIEEPKTKFQPYVLAGHCFDFTTQKEKRNTTNGANRLSSAIQTGIGTHVNFTDRFDLSLSVQYMIHLGTDVHAHEESGNVIFEKTTGGALEGHVLTTLSFNYKIGQLWGRKK